MRIIGIDPGTRITGFGIIEELTDGALTVVDFGVIKIPANLDIPDRYHVIFSSLNELFKKYSPEACVLESQYVHKNVWSIMKLVGAKSIAQLVAAMHNISVKEYAPATLKKSVVGNGRASKEQVQRMVALQLKLAEVPKSSDAADALALAICHHLNLKNPIGYLV